MSVPPNVYTDNITVTTYATHTSNSAVRTTGHFAVVVLVTETPIDSLDVVVPGPSTQTSDSVDDVPRADIEATTPTSGDSLCSRSPSRSDVAVRSASGSTYSAAMPGNVDVLPSPAIAVSSTDSSDSVDVRASAAVDRTTQQFENVPGSTVDGDQVCATHGAVWCSMHLLPF